jgi:CheY-like chemotaxis protein
LLLKTRSGLLESLLRQWGYAVARVTSGEHAVAVCLHNPVEAVVIDQSALAEVEHWSLAQSLKMVRSDVSVIVLLHGPVPKGEPPQAVDCMVSASNTQHLLRALKKCVQRAKAAKQLD